MKETSRSQLWVNGVVIVALIGLAIFFIFQEQPQEKKKSSNEGLFLPSGKSIKEYRLNYAGKLNPDFSLSLSSFEKREAWQGDSYFDSINLFEGKSSLFLKSKNHSLTEVVLDKKVNLQNYRFFDIFVFVNEPASLESLDLKFGNANFTSYYEYRFNNFAHGWNFLRIPREHFFLVQARFPPFNWGKVEKIKLSLISRPASQVGVNFDIFRAEKDLSYLKDWEGTDESLLGVGKTSSGAALLARSFGGGQVATLKQVGEAKDFIFQASISPQRGGRSGLFFRGNFQNGYGYYFLIGGKDSNQWELGKATPKGLKALKKGQIKNVTFNKKEKYWLRVEARGKRLQVYLSRDGKSFIKTAEITNSEFAAGQIGIAVLDQTTTFFDDFYFKNISE